MDLFCENTREPLGVDRKLPRFSWRVNTGERNQYQGAYQILVSTDEKDFEHTIWNSGKVPCASPVNIVYGGSPLESNRDYFWKVKIWDDSGQSKNFSPVARFSTGLLNPGDWKASWIGISEYKPGSAPMFRREFNLQGRVKRARAFICALGYYELTINGKKVGDHHLDPGWTDYRKRVLYVTHDVEGYLNSGPNCIGVMLGRGHYYPEKSDNPSMALQMIFQMEIEFEKGDPMVVASDINNGWKASCDGPYMANSVFNGEIYDGRREKPGWDMAGYDRVRDGTWKRVLLMEPPSGKLVCQALEPIKVMGELKAVEVKNPRENVTVYDLGQNISGWVRLTMRGPRGSRVKISHSELLYPNGLINRENLRSARCEDIYILKGQGTEIYEPRFTYHGFRYVQLEDYHETLKVEELTGMHVRSSVAKSGSFHCSNGLINKIQSNIVWTEADNLHGIPTDCPQRDERMGWLNDATVRAEAAIYNFNMNRFYEKWINDIGDTQGKVTGAITDTAPFFKYGRMPADPVSSSFLIIPWLCYLHYGNRGIIEDHYENMKKWVLYLSKHTEDHIVYYSYYGDWASPATQAVEGSMGQGALSAKTPGSLMSTGYYYLNTVILSQMAEVLGKDHDQREFILLSHRIRDAFNREFFQAETCNYASGNQASNTFPLYLGIVQENHVNDVLENLVNDVVNIHGEHLTTGNLCTKYLMEVLSELGRADVSYILATQRTYPGWGYMVDKGATTIWERWEHIETGEKCGMASHNHPMYGSVSTWFYKYLAGIGIEKPQSGRTKLKVKPHPVGDLTFAEATVEVYNGKVFCRWERMGDGIMLDVEIPWNSSAVIMVPLDGMEPDKIEVIQEGDGSLKGSLREKGYVSFETGSGKYSFVCKKI